MEAVISAQTLLFLQSLAVGFMLGLCMEPLRIYRLMARPGTVAVFFQDIVYWFLCSACAFVFILTVNSGQLRVFLVVGIIIGFAVYFLTLGALIMKASKSIAALLRRSAACIDRKVMRPIAGAYVKTKKKAGRVAEKLQICNKKILNNVNYRLKHNRILLYNLIHTKRSRDNAENIATGGRWSDANNKKANKKNTAHR